MPESQRRPLGVAAASPARSGHTVIVAAAQPGSGELTLGGHADRGLTLAAFYDTGVLERLRLEVRVRLILDLTLSLAWLHANPRLMAAHSHLVIAPSTVVIGLDGVARVDVRAAKKRTGESAAQEREYLAPELLAATASGDQRSDIYSLGVLAWEALAGHRLLENTVAPQRAQLAAGPADARGELPTTLAGPARFEEATRHKAPVRPPGKVSHARLKVAPALTLPADAEWALPVLELALQAMSLDVLARPQDTRGLVARLEALDIGRLASHQEIAEVVQGISAAATLCIAEPTLPSADVPCAEAQLPGARSALATCCTEMPNCAPSLPREPRLPAVARPESVGSVLPEIFQAAPASPAADTGALRPRIAGPTLRAWFFVGLAWLATMGLFAGYVASVLAHR
jgi:Protein tyrosine and serine/threonine kinase